MSCVTRIGAGSQADAPMEGKGRRAHPSFRDYFFSSIAFKLPRPSW